MTSSALSRSRHRATRIRSARREVQDALLRLGLETIYDAQIFTSVIGEASGTRTTRQPTIRHPRSVGKGGRSSLRRAATRYGFPTPTHAEARSINLVLNAAATPVAVPRLQRPYSWDSAETRELWQDLVAFHERFPGAAMVGREYFLGSIVGRSTEVGGATILEVLDGQQRLATLTILIATVRDLLAWIHRSDHTATSERVSRMTS